MAAINAVRDAMHNVDRAETSNRADIMSVPPLPTLVQVELLAMELCVRELAPLAPDQRKRVLGYVEEVLGAYDTQHQARALQATTVARPVRAMP